jgi:hypothetical protein
MKKIIRRVIVALLIVAAGVVILFSLFGGWAVKKSVNMLGPVVLGVPVQLQNARFAPLRGRLQLSGLHIGNPKGFKTASLVEVDRIDVEVDVASLFSDTIVIRKVLVNEPHITFEQGLKNNNVGALLDQLGGGETAPAKPEVEAESGKKVVIDELTLTGGKVKLSVTAAMGLSAPIALATVTMKNIGREGGTEGLGLTAVVRIILGTVLKSVVEAAGGVVGLAADGFKAIGGGAIKVGEGTVDALKSLGGGKAAEGAKAMGQGAVQVSGAAVDGVKQLGSEVGKAIGGLMGGGDTNTPAPVKP